MTHFRSSVTRTMGSPVEGTVGIGMSTKEQEDRDSLSKTVFSAFRCSRTVVGKKSELSNFETWDKYR